MSKHDKKTNTILLRLITCAFVCLVICIIVFVITNNKTTVVQTASTNETFLVLNCKSTSSVNQILDSSDASSQTHTIKAVSKYGSNSKAMLSDLFYNFEGEYGSEAMAQNAMSSMHANYNIFMAKMGVEADDYSPTFSNIETRAKYTLYATSDSLRPSIYRVFALDPDNLADLSMDSIETNYKACGFVCSTEEKNN